MTNVTGHYRGHSPVRSSVSLTSSEECNLLIVELPGGNLLGSDMLRKSQIVIDLVMTSSLEVPNGTYTNAGTEWKDGTKSDIIYVSRLPIRTSLPPVLIEAQNVLDEPFIQRSSSYYLQIIQMFGIKPVALVFCISKVTPKSFETEFKLSHLEP